MITKRSLFYWVRTSNLRIQSLLLLIIAVSIATRVFPLEMQKRIVNQAIGLGKVDLLFLYCGLYLAAVVVAGGLKFAINILQTRLGQETLARIRKELYDHILTLPLGFFRKASSGMIVSSLVTEVVAAGELVGQAVAVPLNNVLTLLAFAGYMFYLNPILAALSFVIYPFILFSIPAMQRRANEANKARVDATRIISGKIGETISGIHEVHSNASYRIENRRFGEMVDQLLKIRITWNIYRNAIKVMNNLFQNMGPFVLFIVGGYLAIHGRFDLGALVAFLSAYEKLYDPWKELLEFYQVYQDAKVSYKRLMEYFDIAPEFAVEPRDRPPHLMTGSIQVKDLYFSPGGGIHLLKQINLDLKPGEHLALVGASGSGKSTLALCIAQLQKYTSGSVKVDGKEVSDLTKRDIAENMGMVAQSPYIFDGTIKENLRYSCEALIEGESGTSESKRELPTLDEMIQVIQQVGLFVDVLRFGLSTMLPSDRDDELAAKIVRIRRRFQDEFGESLAESVEFLDEENYLYHASVATNLCYGTPNQEDFKKERLHDSAYFLDFLESVQLRALLLELGRELAIQFVDVLEHLPPEEILFEQSPIAANEIDEYRDLVPMLEGHAAHQLSEEAQSKLLRLALRFSPGIHTMVALSDDLEKRILAARMLFIQKIQQELPGAFSFYLSSDYIHSQTILSNILYGKPRTDHPNALERINQSIIHLLIEEDLLERIVELGMEFKVGTRGDRLSGGQRQKLAIARTLLKDPPIVILDEATAALDNASQKRIQNLVETQWRARTTVIAVVHRLDIIRGYDKIAVMKAGKILEMGSYDDLIARKGMLYELIHGTKAGLL